MGNMGEMLLNTVLMLVFLGFMMVALATPTKGDDVATGGGFIFTIMRWLKSFFATKLVMPIGGGRSSNTFQGPKVVEAVYQMNK